MGHARLSPSASERWLSCPASVLASEGLEDEESVYAREGTAFHAYAELHCRMTILNSLSEKEFQDQLYSWRQEFSGVLSDGQEDEMHEYVIPYLEFIQECLEEHPHSVLLLEQTLDTGIPHCWGTGDVVIVSPTHVHVIDIKYGQGVKVYSDGNSQFRLYGLGALPLADLLGEVETVYLTVYQPRLDNVHTSEMSVEELLEWREEILPIAEAALQPGAPFGPSEEACRWCPLSGRCRAQVEAVFGDAPFEEDPKTISDERMAELLEKVPLIKQWLADFETAALDHAFKKQVPGWKVVLSGGRRQINDSERAMELLKEAGYSEDQISTPVPPRKLKGIGALEAILGKEDFSKVLGEVVYKSTGKPSLVRESDKRPAANPIGEAARVFSQEEE